MPQIETAYFGSLSYEAGSVIEFPAGLPGFENLRRFVLVELPEYRPLVFVQSVEPGGPCFPALPVGAVEPGYRLEMAPEDVALAGFPPRRQPVAGRDAVVLAILTVAESGITANLLAPLVINVAARRGVQAIRPAPGYSHAHPLDSLRTALDEAVKAAAPEAAAPQTAGVTSCS